MRNPEWVVLSDAERGQLVAIWLLAGDHDGAIPASPELIQKLCYMSELPDLNKFTDLGFIENGWRQHDVDVASSRRQDVTPKAEAEKSREDRDTSYLFVDTSDEVRLAEYLHQKILNNNPKTRKPNIQVWAKQVDLMLRVDKRTPEDIQAVIDWCQEDDFWKVNILSTKKLREKFDQLWVKMTNRPRLQKHDGIVEWLEKKGAADGR
jgi:biopolymer transport protein ExbD